jgi:hypothetical protein
VTVILLRDPLLDIFANGDVHLVCGSPRPHQGSANKGMGRKPGAFGSRPSARSSRENSGPPM